MVKTTEKLYELVKRLEKVEGELADIRIGIKIELMNLKRSVNVRVGIGKRI